MDDSIFTKIAFVLKESLKLSVRVEVIWADPIFYIFMAEPLLAIPAIVFVLSQVTLINYTAHCKLLFPTSV